MMTPVEDAGFGSELPAPESMSSTLLERVKAQDSEAWQRLVELYAPLIYRWCRHCGLSPEDARDIVQDVFRSVIKSIGDFRATQRPGNFRAWLRGITRHRILDHFRDRQGLPRAVGGTGAQEKLQQVPEPSEPSTRDAPPQEEDALWHRALQSIRAEFEDRTWEAFWRVAIDARSPAEVAAELGMSVPGVYQAKSRVLRRVRQELRDLEGDA